MSGARTELVARAGQGPDLWKLLKFLWKIFQPRRKTAAHVIYPFSKRMELPCVVSQRVSPCAGELQPTASVDRSAAGSRWNHIEKED